MNNDEEKTFKDVQDVIKDHQLAKAAPEIAWGDEFNDKTLEEQVAFLKKFANSFNFACDLMQRERNDLAERNQHLEKQLAHHRSTINAQRDMVRHSTDMVNQTKKAYQDKIIKLEEELRKER
jgi:hypothetical protein